MKHRHPSNTQPWFAFSLALLVLATLLPPTILAQPGTGGNISITPVPIDKVKEHYKECLSEKEMEDLIRWKLELKDMESYKALDPNLEVEKVIKDSAAVDWLCDKLPGFLKGIKYGRETGKFMDKNVRLPAYKKAIAAAYKKYIRRQVELNFCKYYDNLNAQDLAPTVANSLGKNKDELRRIFRQAAEQYCNDLKDLRTRITTLENRCLKVPNLVGLTYDKGGDQSLQVGLGIPRIQQPQFKDLKPPEKKNQLIIYKQNPEAGGFLRRFMGVEIWVRNDFKSLKANPPSWLDAKVGNTNTFEITAELLNGKKVVTQDPDCKWYTTDDKVVKVTAKGKAIAAGPGKAEIRVLYDHNDGVKLASHVVRIPVMVLAPPKPPPPLVKKLLSFKLTPPSVVDITIGDPPRQLKGWATFSDAPNKSVDVTKDCNKPWTSDGNPDLKVANGRVTAHSTTLPPAKHRIHASYTFKGQTLKDSVLFRILSSGPGTGPGSGTGTPPPGNTPVDTYSKLTLSKTRIEMDMKSTEYIRAKVWVAKLTQVFQRDVTRDPNLSWSSSNPSIAGIANGSITSKTSAGTCIITATFQPSGVTQPLTAQCEISVKGQPIVMDFSVDPPSGPYTPGQELTFTEKIKGRNKSQYDLTWYVESRAVKNHTWIKHKFKTPGNYTVRLAARHRKTGIDDAIAKSISIEQPPDVVEATIGFSPETNVYKIGSTVGFIAKTQNTKGITEYRWYVSGEYVGSGKTGVSHKFTEDGQYIIKLGLRKGSNFDEEKVTRTLTVGKAGIGTLGRLRNRFVEKGGTNNLEILSQYYRGGSGDWSELIRFNGGRIGPVDHFIHYDGDQQDGWNTGFLIYVPQGKNKLLYKIFHFRWSWNPTDLQSPRGIVDVSGQLDLHNKTLVPDSVTFTRKASRLCIVEWRTTDGSSCRVRIGKFRKTNQDAMSGVKDLGCEEGVYEPVVDEVVVPPEPDTVVDTPKKDEPVIPLSERLVSGTYQVEARVNNLYKSPWSLTVQNGRITGMSKWTCCPAPRTDPLTGYIDGNTVTLTRDCTGQGYSGPCSQIYTGTLNGDVVQGSFTLNGRQNFGTWTLFLDSRVDSIPTDSGQTSTGTPSDGSNNNTADNENGGASDSDGPLGGGGPGSGMIDLEGTPSSGSGGPSDSSGNGSSIDDSGGGAGNTTSSTTTANQGNAPDISGTWKWFNGGTVWINKNGTYRADNGNTGTWKATWNGSEFTYTINSNNGQWIDTLVLQGNTLDGHNQNGTHVWGKRINSLPTITTPIPPGNTGSSATASGLLYGLGTRWDDYEEGWTGAWIRRGKSNVFDALWTLGSSQERATLTISIHGKTVDIRRRQTDKESSFFGQEAHYQGTLAADGVTVTGTYSCDWAPGPYTWRATIRSKDGSGSGVGVPKKKIKPVITGYGKK